MYVDQILVHEDLKKSTYDAMIFNMDKIKNVTFGVNNLIIYEVFYFEYLERN
jgi:hypothetical protein